MMNGGAISWESKRQKVTALSSAESEFYAASAVGCELVFLRQIADAMGFKQSGPTPVAEDNIVCIYMSKSSAMYHKAKAINTRVDREAQSGPAICSSPEGSSSSSAIGPV
eukprot:509986-Rhodomonas_salina.1